MRMPTVLRRLFQAGSLGIICLAVPGITAAAVAEPIKPADVYQLVEQTAHELAAIRFITGQARNEQAPLRVTNAAPREVYFQALTLFRKVDRLSFEHTRKREAEPEVPSHAITPAEVHAVVASSLARLRSIRRELGAEEPQTISSAAPEATPTDVFVALVQVNRQLNLLLEKRFAPSDVFEQVTQGVGYAARLLEHFEDSVLVPEAPPLEPGRTPPDVYRRLIDCYQRLQTIAENSGLSALDLHPDETTITRASPSDVYDIASLLVAELAHLHQQLPDAPPPRKVFYVGRKFPSHVYQRAAILERQLIQLEAQSLSRPAWLAARSQP